jgi:hypothetical protein
MNPAFDTTEILAEIGAHPMAYCQRTPLCAGQAGHDGDCIVGPYCGARRGVPGCVRPVNHGGNCLPSPAREL